MEPFVLEQVSFSYPDASAPALCNVNLTLHAGEFVLLCGRSGCGKTTLLRQLKTALAPHGAGKGNILFYGRALETVPEREQAGRIGYVLQNPENQLVTDKVWHELAFGLENLGLPQPIIRRRVAEMASFFGIEGWFRSDVAQLSGGQKQLLNLAAVMAMQPDVLLLDEPTSQLDPIAASGFLRTVKKINEELGCAVLICEHRLDEVFALCDRAVVLDEGRVLADAPPRLVSGLLKEKNHAMFVSMPSPVRIHAAVENTLNCPLTVREGRRWLAQLLGRPPLPRETPPPAQKDGEEALRLKNLWFRYKKDGPDVLRGLDLTVRRGEICCLMGGNGTGKTTALSLICGQLKPQRGKVCLLGRELKRYGEKELFACLGVLPQDPQCLFVEPTVRQDLEEQLSGSGLSRVERESRLQNAVRLTELEPLLEMHPYDLSGGEQQRAALCKVLLRDPEILLLDEPTKGMDRFFQEKLISLLRELSARGKTILIVSHDVEFCASCAGRCVLIFDGETAAQGTPREFFAGNSFYTTAANRMAREYSPAAVTNEDVIALCRTGLQKKE